MRIMRPLRRILLADGDPSPCRSGLLRGLSREIDIRLEREASGLPKGSVGVPFCTAAQRLSLSAPLGGLEKRIGSLVLKPQGSMPGPSGASLGDELALPGGRLQAVGSRPTPRL